MPVRRMLLAAAVVALLALGSVAPAYAHDTLLGSRPDAGAVVVTPPQRVELLFDANVAPYAPTIVVTSPSGSSVQTGPAQVDGTRVSQPLEQLRQPGEYVVAYRVVSGDGHPVTGTFSFYYGTTPSAQPTAADSGAGSGSTAPIVGLAVLVVVAIVVGGVVARRHQQPSQPG